MRLTDLRGAAAGAVAGLAATVLLTALRTAQGLPLLVEVVSDRLLPLVPVDLFLRTLGLFGGPIMAKEIAFFSGFGAQVAAGAAVGIVVARSRRRRPLLGAVLLGVWVLLAVALWPTLAASNVGYSPFSARLVNLGLLLAALLLFGVTFEVAWALTSPPRPQPRVLTAAGPAGAPVSRRSLLLAGAGLALVAVAGAQVRSLFGRGAFAYDGRSLAGPVTPITPNDRFYVVTKNLVDPDVVEADWRLRVGGLVRNQLAYTLDELAGLPTTVQETTLECISNGVGSGLLSNAEWTGVSLPHLLALAAPTSQAGWVDLRGADGFTHSLPLERARRPTSLVAYKMNGYFLPHLHGFPARAIIPGTYGEVNVKWLTEVELTADRHLGYYESQGWQPDFVHTMSRIDAPAAGARVTVAGSGTVAVHGVAFAGDRGIRSVEVNDGRGWQPARIEYNRSPLAWTLWSLDWRPPGPGPHDLVVRATDGGGRLQDAASHGTAPAGARGYQHRRVTVAG